MVSITEISTAGPDDQKTGLPTFPDLSIVSLWGMPEGQSAEEMEWRPGKVPAAFEGCGAYKGGRKRGLGGGGSNEEKLSTLKAFILPHSQESIIHVANIYCVPTLYEAFCQGLATEAKGTVLVLRKSVLRRRNRKQFVLHRRSQVGSRGTNPGSDACPPRGRELGAARRVDFQISCCL